MPLPPLSARSKHAPVATPHLPKWSILCWAHRRRRSANSSEWQRASVNDQRRGAVVRDFVAGSLATPTVQAVLGLGSPQAVHRLRSRGKIIGAAVGNQTWFPAWQFDGDRVRPDMARILEVVRPFTADPLALDRVMRLARDDLDGLSIAAALLRPDLAERSWRLLAAVGA